MANASESKRKKTPLPKTTERIVFINYDDDDNEPIAYTHFPNSDKWFASENEAETNAIPEPKQKKKAAVQNNQSDESMDSFRKMPLNKQKSCSSMETTENSPIHDDPKRKKQVAKKNYETKSPVQPDEKLPVIYMGPVDPDSGVAMGFSSKGKTFICFPVTPEDKEIKQDSVPENVQLSITSQEIIKHEHPTMTMSKPEQKSHLYMKTKENYPQTKERSPPTKEDRAPVGVNSEDADSKCCVDIVISKSDLGFSKKESESIITICCKNTDRKRTK